MFLHNFLHDTNEQTQFLLSLFRKFPYNFYLRFIFIFEKDLLFCYFLIFNIFKEETKRLVS